MNNEYRQYLIKNANTVIQKNCNQIITQNKIYNQPEKIHMEIIKTYPYLFNGINDEKKPYGYETSYPKELYLSQEKLDNQKRLPLQSNIR
jgi:hypothetical protein